MSPARMMWLSSSFRSFPDSRTRRALTTSSSGSGRTDDEVRQWKRGVESGDASARRQRDCRNPGVGASLGVPFHLEGCHVRGIYQGKRGSGLQVVAQRPGVAVRGQEYGVDLLPAQQRDKLMFFARASRPRSLQRHRSSLAKILRGTSISDAAKSGTDDVGPRHRRLFVFVLSFPRKRESIHKPWSNDINRIMKRPCVPRRRGVFKVFHGCV